ncbi:Druantia anti-phage system protein DruA [Arcobacter sp. F155]|uniref:Druantia anti-phage system protein DruA n=1 Tax=Arcobacter sp. F155 TaxID=2044512 RepID=UPI0013E94F96|nr:Druantia anti-phage system protein DruA [Arcobacter sp. F155]
MEKIVYRENLEKNILYSNMNVDEDFSFTKKQLLRDEIIFSLKNQGFDVRSLFEKNKDILKKQEYKKLQLQSSLEQKKLHKKMLLKLLPTVKPFMKNLNEINPEKIKLKLIEVTHGSIYEKIFKWWNFSWWSMPYQRAYGRQMRFVIWDTYHDAPFGLIGLQSPVLKMSVRDNYLNIPKEELDIWINQSMNAQRIGALPPYNELIGGKMVSLALVSKELRMAYKNKYKNAVTLMENRHINPELLFLTTTSAFGKSSIYNRLKINKHLVAKSLGYTKGYGSFHINEILFQKIIQFLEEEDIDTHRSFGSGPSTRIRLLNKAFRLLDIPGLEQHGLKREFFIFENVSNLKGVLHNKEEPKYYDYKFSKLVEYWKKRWAIARKERLNIDSTFDKEDFVKNLESELL